MSTNEPAVGGSAFPPTHWSMVVHAGHGADTRAQAALETLCRQYWYPLYVFVRRQGRTHHEAEDCTQEFLARLLAADGLARARPEQGRFRTFLLASLRHFLINEWHRAQAARRGGGQAALPLQIADADGRYAQEPADPGLTPEQAFDRNWAVALIDQAVGALRSEYEKSGRREIFAALQPHLWGTPPAAGPAGSAIQAGLSPQAFTVALYRARQRLGVRLRLRVAETVADGADLNAEMRHLIAALNPASGASVAGH